jgi:adhesin transport system outer membrane protein
MRRILRNSGLAAQVMLLFSTAVSAQTLQEAVQQTISTNPNVLLENNERLAVEQELKQAKAGYMPFVDITLGQGWESSHNTTTIASGDDHTGLHRQEASIFARQMLFDGFLTRSEVERQSARVNSKAYRIFGVSEVTALRAAEVYLEILKRHELVAIAKDNLLAHEKTNDQISLRSERGVDRRSDVDQTQGRMALARTNLLAEENNLRDAQANFVRVVGTMPDSPIMPASPELPVATQEDAIATALASHPTLKSAEADVDATIAQHNTARSQFYPRLDLEVGASDNDNLDGVRGTNDDVIAMLRLRYSLSAGQKDIARRDETAHLINAAREVRNNTHRQVIESMQLSWNAFITSREQLDFFKQHVISSEAARDAYRKQFNIGQRTLLDLLDSENEVFVARSAYIQGKYNELFSRYRIMAGMGQLLSHLNVPLPAEAAALTGN